MNRLTALILVLILGCCASADAADTLVANVAEFDAAVKSAKPGDAIVLRNGEWRDAELVFRGTGRAPADQRITLRAETPGQVILTGKSRLSIGGQWLDVEGLHWKNTSAVDHVVAFRIDSKTLAEECRLRHCAIVDDAATDSDGKGASRKWVSIYGRRNVVARCRFDGKRSAGALLVVWIPEDAPGEANGLPTEQLVRHKIDRNFFGPREKLGKNGGETIRIGDSETSLRQCETFVTDNYFYRCDGEAEIISNKSCGNLYARNAFIGCSGALTLRHGNGCHVTSNYFEGDGRKGTGGVRVVGERHGISFNTFSNLTGNEARAAVCVMNGVPDSPANGYLQVRKLHLGSNTFRDCKQAILLGFADKDRKNQTLPPDDVTIEGTVAFSEKAPIFTIDTMPTNLTSERNQFLGKLGLTASAALDWWELDREELEGLIASPLVSDVKEWLQDSGPAWFRPTAEYLPQSKKN